ncbi:MAG: T9SS type B sorting domain-containing protein [Bacteroidetes bacterium]|nr:T9SS type B sorting domain-containing protein [Bacteroidota bacterium]
MNSYGCRDTIQKTIEVRPHSTLFAPNCFTPNGDGKNDDFRPYFTQMKDIQVWIFDRWGLLLTSWEGLQGSWDGYYQGKSVNPIPMSTRLKVGVLMVNTPSGLDT